MSIRAQFQPTIDEFIDNLATFATGSYLAEDEKEFWEAPFDAKCLPQLQKILENVLDNLDGLGAEPEGPLLAAVIQRGIDEVDSFNASQADAVVEPEEKEELAELFTQAARATGAADEALAELPEFE